MSKNQFNALDGSISINPIDFSYQFGLNDNSSQYFNYSEVSVLTNAMTPIVSQMLPIASTLIEGFSNEDTVVGYEVSSVPIQSLSYSPSLAYEKVSLESTSVDVSSMYKSILNTALSATKDLLSVAGGSSDVADQGIALGTAVLELAMTATNFGLNVTQAKSELSDYKKLVNKQIELYNEKADANREFIQQCNEMIKQRQQRFEKSNKVIQGSKSK